MAEAKHTAPSVMDVLRATDDHLQAMQHYGHSHDLRQAMSAVQDVLDALQRMLDVFYEDPMGADHSGAAEQAYEAIARATGAAR